jgi:hypothetical protein
MQGPNENPKDFYRVFAPGIPNVRDISERLTEAEARSRRREILMAYPAATVYFFRRSSSTVSQFDACLRGDQGSSYYLQQGAGEGRCSEGGASNDDFARFHRDLGREGNDRRHFQRQRHQRGRCTATDYGHAWRHSHRPDRST